ncbi:MAG: hypothetical protein ACJAUC_004490, partial [Planctomycetota bacterium]
RASSPAADKTADLCITPLAGLEPLTRGSLDAAPKC